MNRRTYIKRALTIGVLAVSSFSIFQWIRVNRKISLGSLQSRKQLIAVLADTIIPKTESPGAMEANVADFIMDMVWECFDARQQNHFLAGLEKVDSYCLAKYHREFVACTVEERISVLNHLEAEVDSRGPLVDKISNKLFGEPFIVTLKSLTVEGYCTSELGATLGLAYDYIPVYYQPCIALQKNQRSWATS